jgi:fructuronate reductase
MPDTPQRIATDTSQKLAIRFGETIKAYEASDRLDVKSLELIPLVFAGWLRYLMAVDDKGNTFPLSPDPMLPSLRPCLEGIQLGEEWREEQLQELLKNPAIFGVDLYQVGLAEKVIAYFKEMISGIGAVERTLEKTV